MTVIFSKREDTMFLQKIWEGVGNVRIIEIKSHNDADKIIPALQQENDCLLLCGHGTPSGLTFPDLYGFIVSDMDLQYLRGKTVIGIWCYAAEFADYNRLNGFFTSMFISDCSEAKSHGYNICPGEIEAANARFAKRVNELLKNNVPVHEWENVMSTYRKELSTDNFEYFNYCGMVNLTT